MRGRLTLYRPAESYLHQRNPLAKVLATVPAVTLVTITADPWPPVVFLLAATALLLVGGRVWLRRYLLVVGFVALTAFTHVPLYGLVARPELDPTIVAQLGPLRLTAGGVAVGLATALRICALASLALLYAFTTDVMDLVRASVQQWHVSYRFGYGLLAAYRFLPMLETELWTVQAAYRVRGVTHGWGPLGRLRALRRYAIPLFASAIRRAERVALAMDARAFGAFPTRTYRRRFQLGVGDYVLIVSCWLFTVCAAVVLWRVGLLTQLTIAP